MKIAIRYYTRSGNTKKLAYAIAERLGLSALSVENSLDEKVDILFLGCSYYAFDMDEHVKTFLKNNRDKIGKIICFGTSAMMKSMKKPMKKVIDEMGLTLSESEFHCRGEFKFAHKGRPNEDDLKAVREFAQKIVSNS